MSQNVYRNFVPESLENRKILKYPKDFSSMQETEKF